MNRRFVLVLAAARHALGDGCLPITTRWTTSDSCVEMLGGDAAEVPQEALDLAVAAVDRLDVHGPPRTGWPAWLGAGAEDRWVRLVVKEFIILDLNRILCGR